MFQETQDAWFQLQRYGGEVASREILEVLQKLTDINDDVANGRDPAIIRAGVSEAKQLLDKVR